MSERARLPRWLKLANPVIAALQRGEERVNLVELPLQEHAPVLREFPNRVPHGVQFFQQLYDISGTPEEFEALASRVRCSGWRRLRL
jgi:acyl transferase domain-containing protein